MPQTKQSDVRFKCKEKFAPRVHVWLALSRKGVSAPYIRKTKGPAFNADVIVKIVHQNC